MPPQQKSNNAAAPGTSGQSAAQTPAAASTSTANTFAALEQLGEAAEEAVMSYAAAVEKSAASASSSQDEAEKAPGKRRGKLRNPLVWVDLEMTGLDIDKDTIIEIACIITDGDLGKEVMGPCTAIHQPEPVLAAMNEWCQEHHGKSGLTQRVRDSTVSMAEAEEAVLAFVREHTDEGMAQLAGNSIHVDRMFLQKYMPRVVAYLSYRIVDVSSVKELARRWFPQTYRRAPRKQLAHTALSDIKESIEELKYYRRAVFKPPSQCK